MHIRPIEILTNSNARLRGVRAATIAVVALACVFLSAQRVNAQVIDHSTGFGNHSDLTVNLEAGSTRNVFPTERGHAVLELTNGTFSNATSVFSSPVVDITNFTTSFAFEIQPGTDPLADGMMFVIQSDPRGAAALGPGGGGLGYGHDSPGPDPLAIINSVGIKFDIFANPGVLCETSNNTTGLFVDGDSPTCATPGTDDVYVVLDGTGIDLNGLLPLRCDLTYDGTTLTETLTNLWTGTTFTQPYTVDIVSHVGGNTAWVGFTGGTGGLTAIQYVQAWIWQSGM